MESLPGISCIIITHNGSHPQRLPKTLEFLSKQNVPEQLQWEVIVVDNKSTDGSAELCRSIWPNNCSAKFQVISEPELGQMRARMKGIEESRHPIIIFIDDDMRLQEDYISLASEFMNSKQNCGLCCGLGEPVFESEPPEWFIHYYSTFSLTLPGGKEGNVSAFTFALPGGGLIMRKAAWQELFDNGFRFILSGRIGKSLVAGDDDELCLAIRMAGWEVWTDSRFKFGHFLPTSRLNWDYLRKWFRALGTQSVALDAYKFSFFSNKTKFRDKIQKYYIYRVGHSIWHTIQPSTILALLTPGGSQSIITAQTKLGRLLKLLKSSHEYERNIKQVADAKWRKKQY